MNVRKYQTVQLILLILLTQTAWSLNDIPVYYDAWEEDGDGCQRMGIQNGDWTWDVRVADITSSIVDAIDLNDMTETVSTEMIPINCEDAYRGTDALELEVKEDVGEGGDYHLQAKFANNRSYRLTGYKDIRFRVKNLTGEAETIALELVTDFPFPMNINVPISADAEWDEVVVPLEEFAVLDWSGEKTDAFDPDAEYVGVGIAYAKDPDGSALHLLIDDIRLTDGSDAPMLKVPDAIGGEVPEGWPDYLATGYLDTRGAWDTYGDFDTDSDYRYQYIMPETFTSWGEDFVEEYVDKSDELGFKTAFVWYNFGKVSESMVADNLNDDTFMNDYFERYDELLNQMASGGANQKEYLLVLEPDLYGKLMQDGHLPTMDGAEVTVNMSKANELSGASYASNMVGWSEYLVDRAHEKLASKGVMLGHMLNHWGYGIPGQVGQGRIESHVMSGYAQGDFINSLGDKGKGDVIFVEKSDRDAGNPEKAKQDWFWTDDNYVKYFSWTKCLSYRAGLRIVGWQISEGNMEHPEVGNRDDAVQYFVDNPQKWIEAGFIGVLFGAGLSGNANYPTNKVEENDGGWFSKTIKEYMATPMKFSEVTVVTENESSSEQQESVSRESSNERSNDGIEMSSESEELQTSSVSQSSAQEDDDSVESVDSSDDTRESSQEVSSVIYGQTRTKVTLSGTSLTMSGLSTTARLQLYSIAGEKVYSLLVDNGVTDLSQIEKGVLIYSVVAHDKSTVLGAGALTVW
ncbi:MAG: hypothetical protein OCD01_06450 [Fibrobacterales bacterium]